MNTLFIHSVQTLCPPAEEAAGARRHDGPLVLPAEAHPEDQQVQPAAAGRASSVRLLPSQGTGQGGAAGVQRVRSEHVRARPDERREGARAGRDPGRSRTGSVPDAARQRFADHGRHQGL